MQRWAGTLLLLAGCPDRPLYLPETAADLSHPRDMAVPADLEPPDLAAPDLKTPPLHPLSPLSTATVMSHRPTLRWLGGTPDATVDLCRDRGCSQPLGAATTVAAGGSARPDAALPSGVIFWRVRDGSALTPTWQMWVGARDAADTSWGATLDVDGDGSSDVAVADRALDGIERGYLYAGAAAGPALTPSTILSDSTVTAPDWFGMWKLTAVGDLDGDGFGDLAFSSIMANHPSAPPKLGGMVHVVPGSAGGLDFSRMVVLRGANDTSAFGSSFLGGVDVDGDGYGDLVVTSLGFDAPFFIYFGGPGGVSESRSQRIATTSLDAGALVAAADFNGDGWSDLALSARSDDVGSRFAAGRVRIHYGSANGLGAPVFIDAPPSVTNFSQSLGAFDHDGDGFGDLVVVGSNASPSYDDRIFVFHGGPMGLPATFSVAITPPTDLMIVQVAGDIDGDGRDDLVFAQHGPVALPSHATLYLSGPGSSQPLSGPGNFAFSVAAANDIDRDGHSDVIIGAPSDVAGRAFVFFGQAGGLAAPDMGRFPVEIDAPATPDGGAAFGSYVSGSY
jgi:hypothetical protein